jgi:hypothetical protein
MHEQFSQILGHGSHTGLPEHKIISCFNDPAFMKFTREAFTLGCIHYSSEM